MAHLRGYTCKTYGLTEVPATRMVVGHPFFCQHNPKEEVMQIVETQELVPSCHRPEIVETSELVPTCHA